MNQNKSTQQPEVKYVWRDQFRFRHVAYSADGEVAMLPDNTMVIALYWVAAYESYVTIPGASCYQVVNGELVLDEE